MITSRVKASTWTWRDPSNEIILPVTFYLWCAITQNGWTQNDVTGSCAHAPVYKRLRDQVSGVVAIWTPLVHRLPVTCTSCAPTSTKQSTVVKTEKKTRQVVWLTAEAWKEETERLLFFCRKWPRGFARMFGHLEADISVRFYLLPGRLHCPSV